MQLPEHLKAELGMIVQSPAIFTWLDLQIKAVEAKFSSLPTDVDSVEFKQIYMRLVDKRAMLVEMKNDLIQVRNELTE